MRLQLTTEVVLNVLYINCTLKRSPAESHTGGLISKSMEIMQDQGIVTRVVRAVDLDIQPSVDPETTDDAGHLSMIR